MDNLYIVKLIIIIYLLVKKWIQPCKPLVSSRKFLIALISTRVAILILNN